MKNIVKLCIVCILIKSTSCQEIKSREYSINVKISDLESNTISNAKITGSDEIMRSFEPVPKSEFVSVFTHSDNKGCACLKLKRFTVIPSGLLIEKNGYYTTKKTLDWSTGRLTANGNEIDSNVIMKRIKNPIPMKVTSFLSKEISIPECDVQYLYDLELNDFLPPYGKGEVGDIFIVLKKYNINNDVETLEVTIKAKDHGCGFSNFFVDDRESGSQLWSNYEAPVNGYSAEFKLRIDSRNPENFMNQDPTKNLYFRVRPKISPITKETLWNYGKIYGPISFWAMKKNWSHGAAIIKLDSIYFNPNAGDRNVEFDPSKNLIKNMKLCRP
jgi:cell division protein FtsL